jgi:hypothetical protein
MRASHLEARAAHLEMGRRYSELAQEIRRHEFAWGIGESDDPLTGRTYPTARWNGA